MLSARKDDQHDEGNNAMLSGGGKGCPLRGLKDGRRLRTEVKGLGAERPERKDLLVL